MKMVYHEFLVGGGKNTKAYGLWAKIMNMVLMIMLLLISVEMKSDEITTVRSTKIITPIKAAAMAEQLKTKKTTFSNSYFSFSTILTTSGNENSISENSTTEKVCLNEFEMLVIKRSNFE